jgi:CBS domain-containing protein
MQARDVMTSEVVSVSPETPVREVARLLLEHKISAAPVVDNAGSVVGIVSEGDLIGRSEAERKARRDWWLAMLAEGEPLSPEFLAALRRDSRTARDVMSAPVVSVGEDAEVAEIAALLSQYRVKRVPVVRDGRLVGIVSRADLLRAISDGVAAPAAAVRHPERPHSQIGEILATLDHRFFGSHGHEAAPVHPASYAAERNLSVADFRSLVTGFERHRAEAAAAAQEAATERRSAEVRQLIDAHVRDENWNALLHRAREAAERGEREFMLLRFPSDLCADGGRAINSALPEWPTTLRGEAAELYVRWESALKPRGFRMFARILDFPGGKPGDIGLFLGWGEG